MDLEEAEQGINVIFISDVSKGGEKPTEAFWSFTDLALNINEGKLNILRFNLLDIQVYWIKKKCFRVVDKIFCKL